MIHTSSGPSVQITQTPQANVRDTGEPLPHQGTTRGKGKGRARSFYAGLLDRNRSPDEEDYNADEERHPDQARSLDNGGNDDITEKDNENESIGTDPIDDDPSQDDYSKGTCPIDDDSKHSEGTGDSDQVKFMALVL